MSRFDPHLSVVARGLVTPSAAVVLPGGRVALAIENARWPLPATGSVEGAGPWTALSWQRQGGYAALALLPSLPDHDSRVLDAQGEAVTRLGRPSHLDVMAAPLLRLVSRAEGRAGDLFAFLHRHLGTLAPALVAEFLTGAAERDGFVDLAARTECGGLYLQGWAQTLAPGFARVLGLGSYEGREMSVARFAREDVLPPASGVCLFAKLVDADTPIPPALYFERDGRLGRLDVMPAMPEPMAGAAATDHIRAMLDRIRAPRAALGAFRRICRPRYRGQDTLSAHGGPIAAALERVLKADGGTLLVSGWVLDPLCRVEHVILKSRANLYAPLHKTWTLLPRPDLNAGIGASPRFAGLLDARDVRHGFIAHVPARPEQTAEDVYLEIVLEDGSCLFRPVEVTPCRGDGVLPAILSGLSPDEPELPQIASVHLAPFLAGLSRPATPLKRIAPPIPLGQGMAGREVGTVMPVADFAGLQTVCAVLSGTDDAARMDLTVVAGHGVAAGARQALDDAFRFYGLTGQLVVVPDHATLAARLDAGLAAVRSARVLLWQPCALPMAAGWLARLIEEADRPGAGLVSPALTYADGTLHFGAGCELAADDTMPAGLGDDSPEDAETSPVEAGATEIALIDRDLLAAAGGVSGDLFGDAYMHLDLARRLRRAGGQAWCAPSVGFWMIEDPRPDDHGPFARMTRAVDAALLARRAGQETEA